MCKLSDQGQAEALELVALDQLIKVHAQQLKSHTDVIAKGEVFKHVHHVHCAVSILLAQVLQDANLLLRLSVKALLIAHHFQGQVLLQLMVVDFGNLAKASFTNDLKGTKKKISI